MRAPSAEATSSTASFAGRVLAVEHRVHLDDVERARSARTRRRSPSRDAPRGTRARRAPACRRRARARDRRRPCRGSRGRNSAAAACASASRMHGSMPTRSISLIVNTFASSRPSSSRSPCVERAHADERDASRLDRRQRPVVVVRTRRRRARAPPRAPFRARCRSATSPACSGRRARRSRRRRPGRAPTPSRRAMPSATEWSPPSTSGVCASRARLRDELRDAVAQLEDLRQEARAARRPSPSTRRPAPRRCRDRSSTMPSFSARCCRELGVADRRRAHVDAAPALPEIERRADHDDVRDRSVACSRPQG